jgi:hypothetical protein
MGPCGPAGLPLEPSRNRQEIRKKAIASGSFASCRDWLKFLPFRTLRIKRPSVFGDAPLHDPANMI